MNAPLLSGVFFLEENACGPVALRQSAAPRCARDATGLGAAGVRTAVLLAGAGHSWRFCLWHDRAVHDAGAYRTRTARGA